MLYRPCVVQWTLEIVDLDIVDTLVEADKSVLTNYEFQLKISGTFVKDDILPQTDRSTISSVDCT